MNMSLGSDIESKELFAEMLQSAFDYEVRDGITGKVRVEMQHEHEGHWFAYHIPRDWAIEFDLVKS